jgi:hypothetical protein
MSPHCSDSQANEREYVLNVLGENDYPKRLLNDCLRSPVCRNQNNSEGDTSVKGYAIVPYIQGVTEPIKRILSGCLTKNHAERFRLKITFALYFYHELPLF